MHNIARELIDDLNDVTRTDDAINPVLDGVALTETDRRRADKIKAAPPRSKAEMNRRTPSCDLRMRMLPCVPRMERPRKRKTTPVETGVVVINS
jgi:hypothetical protein